jgi:hypothetical protein
MPKFRFIEQLPSLDGSVTIVHVVYGYTYEFHIKADRSGLAGEAHTKRERAEWFVREARKYAEAEARKRKIIK